MVGSRHAAGAGPTTSSPDGGPLTNDEENDEEPEDQPDDGEAEDEEEEEDAGKDTAAQFAFVEEFFKTERAAIRRITDVTELRAKRQAYEAALRTPNPSRIGLVRVRDLLTLVEERELDLRAQRLAGRSR